MGSVIRCLSLGLMNQEGRTSQWWQSLTTSLVRIALDAPSPPGHTFDVRLIIDSKKLTLP